MKTVRVGIVGLGFMGWIHWLAAKSVPGWSVVAVQSRDPAKRAGDWRSIRGNFGPPGDIVDLTGVRAHADFRELLADDAVDLIDLCVPTADHAALAIAALEAGKHVFVEKPISPDVAAADRMIAAAGAAGKLLMVGHVLPCFDEFAHAAARIADGRFGKPLAAHFLRGIAVSDGSVQPDAIARTGGPAVDLHIHDTHFIRLAFGRPAGVTTAAVRRDGTVWHQATTYDFGRNGPVVTSVCGALAMPARPFVHGYSLYLESATLLYESGARGLTVLHADGRSELVACDGDPIAAFARELALAAASVASGAVDPVLDPVCARDALELCHREIAAAAGN